MLPCQKTVRPARALRHDIRECNSRNYAVARTWTERSFVQEVEGASHIGREAYDAERDAFLTGLGLTVLRIPASDVENSLASVMALLHGHPALGG